MDHAEAHGPGDDLVAVAVPAVHLRRRRKLGPQEEAAGLLQQVEDGEVVVVQVERDPRALPDVCRSQDVVEVGVGRRHRDEPEAVAVHGRQDVVRLIPGVDHDGMAGLRVAHHVAVALEGAHHQPLEHLHRHALRLASFPSPRRATPAVRRLAGTVGM